MAAEVSCQALWVKCVSVETRVNLDAELLEFLVMLGEVFEFGRADEGEIGGIEKEYRPDVLEAFLGHFDELAAFEGLGFERLDLAVDEGHVLLR